MSKSNFSFGAAASVRMRRSRFDLSHDVKTSCSLGTLYPIDVTEVLPGDTFKFKTTQVVRLSSAFLRPIMDNIYMDTYYFFVPNRIVYDDWESTMGENKKSSWAELNPPEVPVTSGSVSSRTVADYMGLPVGYSSDNINLLPFRGFAMIYDEWFRNENVIDPMLIQKGETAQSEAFNKNPWSPNNYTGLLPKVGKRKDYFTSALPSPQKGNPVSLPLAGSAPVHVTGISPVKTGSSNLIDGYNFPLFWINGDGSPAPGGRLIGTSKKTLSGVDFTETLLSDTPLGAVTSVNELVPSNLYVQGANFSGSYVDLSSATATNVNDLRLAFQLQKMYEKDARYGTRYREYLLGHFGVSNPDARMQVPEFLGGSRMPINVQQVAQTNTQQESAGGHVESPLASLGAMSQSVGRSRFTKSFTEHGFVFTLVCFRQLHTYQDGINKMWRRRKREDYYDPLFANLGEQPIYSQEIFAGASKDNVFGYNEAWADYRYKPSQVTGQMRSRVTGSLDIWHLADSFSTPPTISQKFIEESSVNLDRTIAVPSSSQDSFICDFHHDVQAFRVMPVYSVPGLVDHH
ncbi:major capsid protein [Dipodfec virus UOA04_Rod_1163]|nr:major capsid protein [Dipodfec virus UOA04_Rod_1163]